MWFFNNEEYSLKKQQTKPNHHHKHLAPHPGNVTVLMMYQIHDFIHNECAGISLPIEALCFTVFCSENHILLLWVLPTSIYKVGLTAGSRWCR